MQGPAPFVPRFFPGTMPIAPPPYIGPLPSGSPLMSSAEVSVPVSYADRPPPTPRLGERDFLPPMDEDGVSDGELGGDRDSPPSFVVAIASPEPPLMANIVRRVPVPRLSLEDVREESEIETLGSRSIERSSEDAQRTDSSRTEAHTPSASSRPPSFQSLGSLHPPLILEDTPSQAGEPDHAGALRR